MNSSSKTVPVYVIAMVVLATAGVTGYAMLKAGYPPAWTGNRATGLGGSGESWIPWMAAIAEPPLAQPGPPPQPGWGVAANVIPAGGSGAIPMAPREITPAHGDKGMCTSCHVVQNGRGTTIPALRASSPMFHEFRGVCGNCHTTNPAAAPAQGAAVPAAALPATAAEAEFLGMELAPLSQLTAAQFSIPAGTQGLVVVEAEAQAAVAGLKPGDVLVAVNEQPVRTLAEFFQVTRNGALNAARLEVLRGGRTWALELSSATPAAPVRPGAGPEAGPGRQGPPLQVNPIPTQAPGGAPRAPSRF